MATRTVTAATVTVKVRQVAPKLVKRVFSKDEAAALANEQEPDIDSSSQLLQDSHRQLLARHLCPVCPIGVAVLSESAAKSNGGSFRPCCKARPTVVKTVTKHRTVTAKKTKTQQVTKTVSITATVSQKVNGRLFKDINGNGVYDAGTDTVIPFTRVVLQAAAAVSRARAAKNGQPELIAEAITDAQGLFSANVSMFPGETLQIATAAKPDVPLISIPTNPSGLVPENVDVAVGVQTTTTSKTAATSKAATQITNSVPLLTTAPAQQSTTVVVAAPTSSQAGPVSSTATGAATSTNNPQLSLGHTSTQVAATTQAGTTQAGTTQTAGQTTEQSTGVQTPLTTQETSSAAETTTIPHTTTEAVAETTTFVTPITTTEVTSSMSVTLTQSSRSETQTKSSSVSPRLQAD